MARKNSTRSTAKKALLETNVEPMRNGSSEESAYSLQSAISFINNNFGLLLMMTLFFIGGFFVGSLWTENQLLKNGGLGGGTNTGAVAASPAAGAAAPSKLTRANFIAFAADVGVKKSDMEKCVDDKKYAQVVNDQMSKGSAAGISGTPGTVVVVNGQPKEVVSGAVPVTELKAVIDKYLKDPNATPTPDTGLVIDKFVPVSKDDRVRGNKNASVYLVEYSDYECPFCRRFHPTMQQVMTDYGDKVAWVYRHYPLSFHPTAQPSAEAAECVFALKGNDAFWKFSDKLFE